MERDTLEARIVSAFESVEYPGDGGLRGSDLGDEPYLLEADFKGKVDRYGLPAEFLDQAPDGFATALSFFSDEAFHYYLPAYLLADLDGRLESVTPVFHLTHGLDAKSQEQRINPRLYGERTWSDHARRKFAMFDAAQAAAIVGYLEAMREASVLERERESITQALESYWLGRAE